MDQATKKMMSGPIPPINVITPKVDIATLNEPTKVVMSKLQDQLGTRAEEFAATAIQSNYRLQDQLAQQSTSVVQTAIANSSGIRVSLSEQFAQMGSASLNAYLGTGTGALAQAKEALKTTYSAPTIAEYLAKNGTSSFFAFQGSSISEQLGPHIDTKSLMGLSGMSETGANLAEQWRLSISAAAPNFGGPFETLREALNFEQSLKTSVLAQALLGKTQKLAKDEANWLAGPDLTESANAGVEEALDADQDLSLVVGYIQQYFVVYLGFSPEEAHNLVRRIVWILLVGAFVGGTSLSPVISGVFGAIGFARPSLNAAALSKRTADVLIPDGKPGRSD